MNRTPWKPGDPIGCGEVYLPTRKIADQYAAACRAEIINTDARAICAIPDLATRRAALARYPAKYRDALKSRIQDLWKK